MVTLIRPTIEYMRDGNPVYAWGMVESFPYFFRAYRREWQWTLATNGATDPSDPSFYTSEGYGVFGRYGDGAPSDTVNISLSLARQLITQCATHSWELDAFVHRAGFVREPAQELTDVLVQEQPKVYIDRLSSYAPVQAWGMAGTHQFFFRGHRDQWTFGVAKDPTVDPVLVLTPRGGFGCFGPYGEPDSMEGSYMAASVARHIIEHCAMSFHTIEALLRS